MADDIVTRIRMGDNTLGAPEVVAEIERLREVAEAADRYHDVACNPDWCRLCCALQVWKEAHNG